jgi:hypothetical protein
VTLSGSSIAIVVPAIAIYLKEAAQPLHADKQIASALTENSCNKVGKQHQAEGKKNQKK